MRLLRRLLGMPYESGYWTAHPDHAPPKGLRHREPGILYQDPAKGYTRLLVQGSEECEDLEAGALDGEAESERGHKVPWWQRAHRVHPDAGDEYGTQASIPRTTMDAGLNQVEEETWLRMFTLEGDETQMSVSFAEDVWHVLTVDLSIVRLLVLEILLEFWLIFSFALGLFVLALIEDSAPAGESRGATLVSKLLLSLTSVRLSTDSIFGWKSHDASTGLEVAVLALQGWLHWLLLCVASAVIVARALQPLRQVVFSPDCCLSDESLQIRMQVIRHRTVTLHNMKATLQAVIAGNTHTLKLRNDLEGWSRWSSAMPLTIQHDIDESSPLHPSRGLSDKLMQVRVAIEATDNTGGHVFSSMVYYMPGSFFAKMNGFKSAFHDAGYGVFPRVLVNHKFIDQIRMFRDAEGKPMPLDTNPCIAVNIDHFASTCLLPPKEPPAA